MERLDSYLKEHFEVPAKNPSEEAQRRWRSAVGLVKNRRRRFRMVPDLDRRSQDEAQRQSIQVLSYYPAPQQPLASQPAFITLLSALIASFPFRSHARGLSHLILHL